MLLLVSKASKVSGRKPQVEPRRLPAGTGPPRQGTGLFETLRHARDHAAGVVAPPTRLPHGGGRDRLGRVRG